jgi:hypothetical protein
MLKADLTKATYVVLGALVGPAFQQQSHTVNVASTGSANQCSVTELRVS